MINPFLVNRLIVSTIVFVYRHEKTLNFWGTGEPLVYRISIETLTFKSFLKKFIFPNPIFSHLLIFGICLQKTDIYRSAVENVENL